MHQFTEQKCPEESSEIALNMFPFILHYSKNTNTLIYFFHSPFILISHWQIPFTGKLYGQI